MIQFRIAPHSVLPDKQVVEIVSDGKLLATLTTGDKEHELRLISKHDVFVTEHPGVLSVHQIQIDTTHG